MSFLLDSVFFLFFSLLFRRCILSLLSSSCHRHRFALQHKIKIGCPFLGHLLQLSDGDSCRSQFLNQSRHFHLFGNVLCSSGTRRHQGSLAFFNAAKNGIESTNSARLTRGTGDSRNGLCHPEGDRVDVQMYIRCYHPLSCCTSCLYTPFNNQHNDHNIQPNPISPSDVDT